MTDEYYEISEVATTTIEAFQDQTKVSFTEKIINLFTKKAVATTYYTSAYDGLLQGIGLGNWAATRGASTGSGAFASADLGGNYDPMVFVTNTPQIFRSVYPFQSVDLNSGQTVSAASFFARGQKTGGTSEEVYLVKTTQESVTSIEADDYGRFTLTEYASLTNVNTTLGWKEFVIDSSKFNYLTDSADVKLGLVGKNDYTNTVPGDTTRMQFYGSASIYDPYLVITYTEGATRRRPLFIN
jgi:hypothetical protein